MSEFVNRHGKRMKVDVDEVMTPVPKSTKQRSSEPVSKPRRKLPRMRFNDKIPRIVWIMLIATVAAGLLAGLVIADSVKRDYERQAAAMRRSVSDASKTLPSSDTTASSVASGLLKQLNAPTACRVSGVDVASWYGEAKRTREDCQQTAQAYTQLRSALEMFRTTAAYLETSNITLQTSIESPGEGAFAIPGEYAERWKNTSAAITVLKPSDELASVQKNLSSRVQAIATAWQKLSDANRDQDATAFNTASDELTTAYGALRASSGEIQAIVTQQQATINDSLKKLQSE